MLFVPPKLPNIVVLFARCDSKFAIHHTIGLLIIRSCTLDCFKKHKGTLVYVQLSE